MFSTHLKKGVIEKGKMTDYALLQSRFVIAMPETRVKRSPITNEFGSAKSKHSERSHQYKSN